MTTAVASAHQVGALFHLETCPNWDESVRTCACPKDDQGRPDHYRYQFHATPPDERSPDEWARHCAQEAVLLTHQNVRPPHIPRPLLSLVGMTVKE